MTDFSSPRRRKLFELHTRYLTAPLTPKQVAEAEACHRNVVKALELKERAMLAAVKEQKRTAEKKKALEAKHAKLLAKIAAERQAIAIKAGEVYDEIQELAGERKVLEMELDALVERLVLGNGSGPIVLDGVTYDFGCHGERVYLVRRTKQSLPRKGRR